jgi:broad specificity phosphatase PhoE
MIQIALAKIICGSWPIITALNFLPSNVIFIRHAEAEHNAAYNADHPKLASLMHDPPLTERGRAQALAVRHELGGQHFSLVVVSPLSRALETATIIFGNRKIPILVFPEVSEHCLGANCLLSNIERLKHKFPNIDFAHMTAAKKRDLANESQGDFLKRIEKFSDWIVKQGFLKIAVVSHGGFLKWLIGRDFANAEVYDLSMPGEPAL